jgi:hypothetical protein
MLHLSGGVIHLDDFDYNAEEVGLNVTFITGNGGLVVKAYKKARGCWLKHLPEDVIIGCPARDNFWEMRGFHSCLILRILAGLPYGFVFCFWGGRSAFRASILPPHLSQLGP